MPDASNNNVVGAGPSGKGRLSKPEGVGTPTDSTAPATSSRGAIRPRLHARELGFKAAVFVEGIACATWMYDPEHDDFLVVFLRSGILEWMPRARFTVDTSCFLDGRKVAEKAAGAFEGEITYQPPDDYPETESG